MPKTDEGFSEILALIKIYINKQVTVCSHFLQSYKDKISGEITFDSPKKGLIEVKGEIWDFQKHGCGYRFISHDTKECLEAHRGMLTDPAGFDAWRLSWYFESINLKFIDSPRGKINTEDEDAIRNTLNEMCDLGILERSKNHNLLYKLTK